MMSSGSPDQMTTSPSMPGVSEPTRSSSPMILAGLIVIERSATSRSRPSLTASVAWWIRKWIGTTGWSVVIAISTPARGQEAGVAQRPVAELDLRPGGEQRADDHRNAALGQHVGQQVRLGAVVDHQAVAELVGQPQRGGDVVGAVVCWRHGSLAVEHPDEHLQLEVRGRTACPRSGRAPAWPCSPAPRRTRRGSPRPCPAGSRASASGRRRPASGSRPAPTSRPPAASTISSTVRPQHLTATVARRSGCPSRG